MDKHSVHRKFLSALLWVSFLFPVSAMYAQDSQPDWQKSLEFIKEQNSEAVGDLQQLKLIDYTYKGKIKSESEKSRIINAMYADKSPMSFVLSSKVISDTILTKTDTIVKQKEFPIFEIITVRQAVESGKLSQDSIQAIKHQQMKYIPIGTDYLELVWGYKGKEYRTTAIVDQHVVVDLITAGLRTGGGTFVKATVYHTSETGNLMDVRYEAKGVVPEWVKRVTTPEEYKVWKDLSQYFRINYEPIKYMRTYSDARKKEIYQNMREYCDSLSLGKKKVSENETYEMVVGILENDTLAAYAEKTLECKQKKFLLYTSLNGYDAHAELDLTYVYDPASNKMTFLESKVVPKSFSNMQTIMEKPTLKIDYVPSTRLIHGYCFIPSFTIVDAEGVAHSEYSVNVDFKIEP